MRGLSPAILASSGLYVPPPPSLDTSGIIRGGGGLAATAFPGGQWGDGAAFGSRPAQTSTIHLNGQSSVVIENLHFDGGADPVFIWRPNEGHNTHVPIMLENCSNVIIRYCDFEDVSEGIALATCNGVTVEYCRMNGLVGPGERVTEAGGHDGPVTEQTGNFLQTIGGSNVHVRNNKIITYTSLDPWAGEYIRGPEDVISLYGASDSDVMYNQIDATDYFRDFGTGTILGDGFGDDCTIAFNTYLNPGQVGIAVAGGYNHLMEGNLIYRDIGQVLGSGNTAAYFWDYNGNGIGGGVVKDNRARFQEGGGFWNPDGATEINNNWNDTGLARSEVEFTL